MSILEIVKQNKENVRNTESIEFEYLGIDGDLPSIDGSTHFILRTRKGIDTVTVLNSAILEFKGESKICFSGEFVAENMFGLVDKKYFKK